MSIVKRFRQAGKSEHGWLYEKGRWPVTKVKDVLPKRANIVGPFPVEVPPSKTGPYRVEQADGTQFWSFFDGRNWCMQGKNLRRAITRSNKPTGNPPTRWYGIDRAV